MMRNKGQAAMEFLMTYGWAILVVLAAIAALAYFGVLAPSKFLPEKCTLPSGVACIDSSGTAAGFTFVIKNANGFDMSNITINVEGTGCTAAATGLAELANNEQATYTVSCAPAKGQFSGTLSVSYVRTDTGVPHTVSGDLVKAIA